QVLGLNDCAGCIKTTFAPVANFQSTSGGSVLGGDFNADGAVDLVTAGAAWDYQPVSVLLNNGNGGFGAPILAGINGNAIAAADFKHDGHLDLAVSDDQSIALLYGTGNGQFGAPVRTNAAGSPGFG